MQVPCLDTPAWSPGNPHLVPVAVELLDAARPVLGRREFAFGFRTLAMRDGQVQLNGRPYPLKGVHSIGNECNTTNPEAEAFLRALAATIREADPTRLLSCAALYGSVGPIADIVDVLGINSYWGWYDKIWGGKGFGARGGFRVRGSGFRGTERAHRPHADAQDD